MAQDIRTLVPHIGTYIEHGTAMTPYVIRTAPPGFRSEVVNTDEYGHRFSHDAEGLVDSHSWGRRKNRGLALGNSFVFGYGATSDRTSFVSLLNAECGLSFLNLGIPAGNSTQELVSAIPFLEDTQRVLICSGMVNLNLNLLSAGRYDLYGAFAGEPLLERLGKREFRTLGETSEEKPRPSPSPPKEGQGQAGGVRLTPGQVRARFDQAVALHLRDLRLIVRACGPSVPVFFAFQPLVVMKPELTTEERELVAFYRRHDRIWWKVSDDYSSRLWPEYIQAIRQGCSDQGVAFADLNDLDFDGWCFVDYSHMTDRAYGQVAAFLAEWMEKAAR